MIKYLKSVFSMKKTGRSFYDSVGGNVVNYWKDCFGDEYMAVNRFGMRVKL